MENTLKQSSAMTPERKKNVIRSIFDGSFTADSDWNRWFFERVYKDDEAWLLAPDNHPVSCAFLQKYKFRFHGTDVPMGYISGAATARDARHHGYMSRLLRTMITRAYNQGLTFLSLIPAQRRLFFFYDKFGFATVFFNDIERYSALHTFACTEGYSEVTPEFKDFSRLEYERESTVIHSERDFQMILEDNAHDGGTISAVADDEGVVRAMAFADSDNDEIHVKEILGNNVYAKEMALGLVKDRLGEKPMVVYGAPTGRKEMMRARGMMRIVNVFEALCRISEAHKEIDQVIRVSDQLIPANNGIFILCKGECKQVETTTRRITLDVSVTNLTKILFSSHKIGEIFNLPTSHALLPLMLD